MQKLPIIESRQLDIIIQRLCHQLIENHDQFEDTVILGIQPRGIFLADRIKATLDSFLKKPVELGYLDITFFRDDFRRRDTPIQANETYVPFLIEGKHVILVDDVLYTGRSIRSALSAMTAYGRPEKVELLTLIDRRYSRDLPIEPTYVGRQVNTMDTERVMVEWQRQGAEADQVSLVKKA